MRGLPCVCNLETARRILYDTYVPRCIPHTTACKSSHSKILVAVRAPAGENGLGLGLRGVTDTIRTYLATLRVRTLLVLTPSSVIIYVRGSTASGMPIGSVCDGAFELAATRLSPKRFKQFVLEHPDMEELMLGCARPPGVNVRIIRDKCTVTWTRPTTLAHIIKWCGTSMLATTSLRVSPVVSRIRK